MPYEAPLFQPMATFSLINFSDSLSGGHHLAHMVGEIGALMVDLPFMVFFKDKVSLRPHP